MASILPQKDTPRGGRLTKHVAGCEVLAALVMEYTAVWPVDIKRATRCYVREIIFFKKIFCPNIALFWDVIPGKLVEHC
jgi:hypothetical protein